MNMNPEFPTLRLIVALLRRGTPVHATKDGERFRIGFVRELAPNARRNIRGILFVRRADDRRWVEPDTIELL